RLIQPTTSLPRSTIIVVAGSVRAPYQRLSGPVHLPGARSLQSIEDEPGDAFDRDPLLGHRIAVADRDRAVLERVHVDRDAPRRPDLVLAAVELADGGRVVIDGHRVPLQVGLDLVAQ